MAVSQMKKLSVIAPKSGADKLISALQRLGCVEVSPVPETAVSEGSLSTVRTADAAAGLEAGLGEAKKAVEFLTRYDLGKKSLFAAPEEISVEDFDAGLDVIAADEVKKANLLCDEITKLQGKIAEIKAVLNALEPWLGFEAEIPEYKTEKTVSAGGSLPGNVDTAALEERLSPLACVLQTVTETKFTKTVYVTSHRDDWVEVRRVLASFGFTKCGVAAGEAEGYAAGAYGREKKRLEEAQIKLEAMKRDARTLSKSLPDVKALCDIYETRKERLRAKELTAETEKTVMLWGWVPAKEEKRAAELLDKRGCAYSFDEPEEGDDVPVLLSNSRFASNFEPVLTMYALPAYGRFDPTAIMSVFYIIIFGLMFADVGYGLILLAGSLAALKLMKPKESMKRFLTMFAICSGACILGGMLFGGYFGDLPVALLENFGGRENVASPALLFDMIEEPMLFLGLSLGVGAVHLVAAMIVKFIILVRDGEVFSAIADVGSWLVLFAGIGVFFINSTAGLVLAGVGALMLVATQGRHEKNIIMKVCKGVMSLYDIVSYASDLLSYSRILALSLASAVIASVVNLLGTMGGFSVVGLILFAAVFLIGHTINFAVNILGTYVHTSRLQYIEFFGKFFEPGGREFAPLTFKSKYVNLK